LPSKFLQVVIVVIDFIVLFSTINPCRGVTGVSTHRWLGAWEVIDHRGLHSGGDAAILGAVCLAKSVSRMHSRSCTVSSHRYFNYTQIIYDIFFVHRYIYIYYIYYIYLYYIILYIYSALLLLIILDHYKPQTTGLRFRKARCILPSAAPRHGPVVGSAANVALRS
jgi:hypothetical protein